MEGDKVAKRKSEESLADVDNHKRRKDSTDCNGGTRLQDQNDCLDGTEEYEFDDPINGVILEGSADISDKTEEYSQDNQFSNPGSLVNNYEDENDNTKGENVNILEPKAEYEKTSVVRHESVQRDAEVIAEIVNGVDVGTLYDQVLKVRKENNRIDIVTNEVLEKMVTQSESTGSGSGNGNAMSVTESASDEIFKDVAEVLVKCPDADPNRVYDMLEKCIDAATRVECVIRQLPNSKSDTNASKSSSNGSMSVKITSSEKSTDLLADPDFKSNPLYNDVKTLHKVLPDKDQNELYAYLEAHFDKANRVQIVIDELAKSESEESLPAISKSSSFGNDISKGKAPQTAEDRLQTDLKELRVIFPDCDPNFLFEKLEEKSNDPERVGNIAYALFESNKYPKLSEILEKEKKEETKRKYKRMEFILNEFMVKFPNPFEFFADEERIVSNNYKTHVMAYLKNTYPYVKDGFFKKVLEAHNYHLNPSILEIEGEMLVIAGGRSKKLRKTPRTEDVEFPEEPDELFFQEVMFNQHQQQIRDHLDDMKRTRELRLEEAKKNGELHECGCCFDDECLFEDMQACADGHIFCKECIRRSCEAAVGQGKSQFLCLTGSCEHQFPLSILQEILPATMFSLALRKLQEEEIQQANIPDLVSCPFCSFATIMTNPDDKVFNCLNPDCLKASCRLCKEPNHIPLRCDEIEKQGETSMRAFIENKMSEAMLRLCPRCKKRFYKIEGCNKMTCTCGMTMCYVCREAPIDYNHFNGRNCNEGDVVKLHEKEMKEAAEAAREQFIKEHPEAADIDMKYDPVKLLNKYKEGYQESGHDYDDGASDFDESGSSDSSDSSESYSNDDSDDSDKYYDHEQHYYENHSDDDDYDSEQDDEDY